MQRETDRPGVFRTGLGLGGDTGDQPGAAGAGRTLQLRLCQIPTRLTADFPDIT